MVVSWVLSKFKTFTLPKTRRKMPSWHTAGELEPRSSWRRKPSLERERDTLFLIQTSWSKPGHSYLSLSHVDFNTILEGLHAWILFSMNQPDWILKNTDWVVFDHLNSFDSFAVTGISLCPFLAKGRMPSPTVASSVSGTLPMHWALSLLATTLVHTKSPYSS